MFNKQAINELTTKVEELNTQLSEIKLKVDVMHYNRDWKIFETAPVNEIVRKRLEHLDLSLVAIPAQEKSFVLTQNKKDGENA